MFRRRPDAPAAATVAVTVEGREVRVPEGASVAAAVLLAGFPSIRETGVSGASRGRRSSSPRARARQPGGGASAGEIGTGNVELVLGAIEAAMADQHQHESVVRFDLPGDLRELRAD